MTGMGYTSSDFDLQLFARQGPGGEKTEEPTQKRKEKAVEEGQFARSRDLVSTLILLAAILILRMMGEFIFTSLKRLTVSIFDSLKGVPSFSATDMIGNIQSPTLGVIGVIARIALPLLLTIFLVGIVSNIAQIGFHFRMSYLKPKWSRLKPSLRRIAQIFGIFSRRSMIEFVKNLFKIFIIGYLGYSVIWGNRVKLLNLVNMPIEEELAFIASLVYTVVLRVVIAMLTLSIFDYFYQRWEFREDLKMTKMEVKDEFKQQEGDPLVKSKIRQRQRELALRRMMQAVPRADVVITNPTHYAVAIQYDNAYMKAPTVVAKGKDLIAIRIKEIAEENGIVIVENKPLAQSLYETVEVGDEIPPEMYQAVAEVLAYVYRLKRKAV
ncbi:MAG: flagellar biosynthesis protein FlhB [bacterium]